VPLDRKRIEVDLKQQIATAYEGDKPVFSARVATGTSFRLADGTVQSFITTPGAHRIFEKRPSRRMIGGRAGDSDHYDLPGISWVSYFTRSRIAFHGTYWHNDYGRPRSHGCVNMLPEDAHWVYRWTTPKAIYERPVTFVEERNEGSLVKVI
jgi:lipoprotein-anchoring transpeptidase ErfK/SrfK